MTEIAEFFGKHKQNVAQHYTRKPDFPQPAAELPWSATGGEGSIPDVVGSVSDRAQRSSGDGCARGCSGVVDDYARERRLAG